MTNGRTRKNAFGLCVLALAASMPVAVSAPASAGIDAWAMPFDKAQAYYAKRIEKDPQNAQLHLHYANVLLNVGLLGQALFEFEKASTLSPNDPEPLIALADIFLQTLDFERAQSYASRALAIRPNSSAARIVLLNALLQRQQISAAEQELKKLLEAEPRNARVLQLASDLYGQIGDYAQAREYLQRALKVQPGKIEWVLAYCQLLENSGKPNEASAELRRVLEKEPNSTEARLHLARNLEVYKHDYDAAVAEYMRVLELDKQSPTALAGIERCRNKKNNLALRLKQSLQSYWRKR